MKKSVLKRTKYVLVRKKSWIFNWVFTLILFALLLSVPNKLCAPDTDLGKVTQEDLVDFRKHKIENSEFTFELFREYADLVGLPNPEISVRQSMLETGFFTSTIFNENNNLFGMKHPRVRPTKSVGSARGHAVYEHWTDSVEDYVLWYEYMTRNGGYVDYKHFLKKVGYAEDEQYINKLLTINFV